MRKRTILYLAIVVALIAIPFAFEGNSSFSSSDDGGPEWLTSMGYHPWIQPFWKPPTSDMEAGLFAMQAAIGGGIVGFVFGMLREQAKAKKREKENKEKNTNQLKTEI